MGLLYISASEMWPDRRRCLWWEGPYKRGTTVYENGYNIS
jgi:hypothetical protein